MIVNRIKLDVLNGKKLIEIIKDYQKNYMFEGVKHHKRNNFIYVRFPNIFDFERLRPTMLNHNIKYELDKVTAYKEEIKEEYQHIIEKYLD
ncbi:MAG: hypothetical protein ACRCX2_15120 [Paraclostridium sp.]